MRIKNPQWLEVKSDGNVFYGFNQEWFGTPLQRASGCGPTAAAMLLHYLNKRDSGPLPYQNDGVASATAALEDVWRFVTPGALGLNSTDKFVKGVGKLSRHYGASWVCRQLKVKMRDSVDSVAAFLQAGLSSDCPVAFLNLHAGVSSAFDGWHWIVVIALEAHEGRHIATGYDGGEKITFDLGQWVESTKIGGGFVYLT